MLLTKIVLTSIVPRMKRVGDDLPEDLGREAPERRQAAARATAAIGGRLRREHRGELVYARRSRAAAAAGRL